MTPYIVPKRTFLECAKAKTGLIFEVTMDKNTLNLASSKRKQVSCARYVHLVVTEILPMSVRRKKVHNAIRRKCSKSLKGHDTRVEHSII